MKIESNKLGLSFEVISEILEGKHDIFEPICQRRIKRNYGPEAPIPNPEYIIKTIIKNKKDSKYYSVIWFDHSIPEGEEFRYDLSLNINRVSLIYAKYEQLSQILRVVLITILTILFLFIWGMMGQYGKILPLPFFISISILPTLIYLTSFSKLFKKISPEFAYIFKILLLILMVFYLIMFIGDNSIPIRKFLGFNINSGIGYLLYILIMFSIVFANYLMIRKSFEKVKFD